MFARSDRFKRTNIVVLLLTWLVFACYVAHKYGSPWRKSRSISVSQSPVPGPLVKGEDIKKADVEEDTNKGFRIVPQTFEHVDFKNHSYGHYRLSSGKRMELILKEGEHRYDYPVLDRGWFAFEDVYYTDVNADGNAEAVVLLWHVQCGGGSCNGGAALIYIYAAHKRKLQTLWRYESGSLAYGCGLKSFSVQARQIILDNFGRCPHSAPDDAGSAKFVIEDMTRSVFRFNGRRFTRRRAEFISVPSRDVKNYKPEIRIS